MRAHRLRALRSALDRNDIDVLLVSQRLDCRYLSGFSGSYGYLLISQRDALLVTDFRYRAQAGAEAPDFELVEAKGHAADWLPGVVRERGWRRLGLDAADLPYEAYDRLSRATTEGRMRVELVPTTGMVSGLRMVKDREELRLIEDAARLVSQVFEEVRGRIVPGLTEREAAWEVEKALREGGSEPLPFDVIMASGANSALPHAKPTEKIIAPGEPVVIDVGARLEGYCSDFSRTLCAGEPDSRFLETHQTVLQAQLAAIEGITAGMTGADADGIARQVIQGAGHGGAFGHGLGHGVGLDVHEGPRLAPGSTDLLGDGMVFTIEPGIYVAGVGGCRIEDVGVLEDGRVRLLTSGDRDLRP